MEITSVRWSARLFSTEIKQIQDEEEKYMLNLHWDKSKSPKSLVKKVAW